MDNNTQGMVAIMAIMYMFVGIMFLVLRAYLNQIKDNVDALDDFIRVKLTDPKDKQYTFLEAALAIYEGKAKGMKKPNDDSVIGLNHKGVWSRYSQEGWLAQRPFRSITEDEKAGKFVLVDAPKPTEEK